MGKLGFESYDIQLDDQLFVLISTKKKNTGAFDQNKLQAIIQDFSKENQSEIEKDWHKIDVLLEKIKRYRNLEK